MAKDEMNEMTTDKWGHEVWGSVRSGSSNLTFYFAKEDHWIAKETRDQLIAARGGTEEWHPRMVVDGGAMKHAFCLSESMSLSQGGESEKEGYANGEQKRRIACPWPRGLLSMRRGLWLCMRSVRRMRVRNSDIGRVGVLKIDVWMERQHRVRQVHCIDFV